MASINFNANILKATETVEGYAVRNIKYISSLNMYVGQVQDPQSYTEDKWCGCNWDKRGKCKNRNRADCNLKLD